MGCLAGNINTQFMPQGDAAAPLDPLAEPSLHSGLPTLTGALPLALTPSRTLAPFGTSDFVPVLLVEYSSTLVLE